MDPVQQMAEALSARAALRAAADAELAQRIAAEHTLTKRYGCINYTRMSPCPTRQTDGSASHEEHLVLVGILAGRAAR